MALARPLLSTFLIAAALVACRDSTSTALSGRRRAKAVEALKTGAFEQIDDFVNWQQKTEARVEGAARLVVKRTFRGVHARVAAYGEPSAGQRVLTEGDEADAWSVAMALMDYRMHVSATGEFGLRPLMEDPRAAFTYSYPSVDVLGEYWALGGGDGASVVIRDHYAGVPREFRGKSVPSEAVGVAVLNLVSPLEESDEVGQPSLSVSETERLCKMFAALANDGHGNADIESARCAVALAFTFNSSVGPSCWDFVTNKVHGMYSAARDLEREVHLVEDLRRALMASPSPNHMAIVSRELAEDAPRFAFIEKVVSDWRAQNPTAAANGTRTLLETYRLRAGSVRQDIVRVLGGK